MKCSVRDISRFEASLTTTSVLLSLSASSEAPQSWRWNHQDSGGDVTSILIYSFACGCQGRSVLEAWVIKWDVFSCRPSLKMRRSNRQSPAIHFLLTVRCYSVRMDKTRAKGSG